jgi:hypothetical protein
VCFYMAERLSPFQGNGCTAGSSVSLRILLLSWCQFTAHSHRLITAEFSRINITKLTLQLNSLLLCYTFMFQTAQAVSQKAFFSTADSILCHTRFDFSHNQAARIQNKTVDRYE